MTKKKHGECCEAMDLVLSRAGDGTRPGVQRSMMMNFKTQKTSFPIVLHFNKAKKDDTSTYGAQSQWAKVTYSVLRFCPFCGAKINKDSVNHGDSTEKSGGAKRAVRAKRLHPAGRARVRSGSRAAVRH